MSYLCFVNMGMQIFMLVQICKMDRGGIKSFYLKCLSVEDKGVTAECNVIYFSTSAQVSKFEKARPSL